MGVRCEESCVRSDGQEERGRVLRGSMLSLLIVARRKREVEEETKSLKAVWRDGDAGVLVSMVVLQGWDWVLSGYLVSEAYLRYRTA